MFAEASQQYSNGFRRANHQTSKGNQTTAICSVMDRVSDPDPHKFADPDPDQKGKERKGMINKS